MKSYESFGQASCFVANIGVIYTAGQTLGWQSHCDFTPQYQKHKKKGLQWQKPRYGTLWLPSDGKSGLLLVLNQWIDKISLNSPPIRLVWLPWRRPNSDSDSKWNLKSGLEAKDQVESLLNFIAQSGTRLFLGCLLRFGGSSTCWTGMPTRI